MASKEFDNIDDSFLDSNEEDLSFLDDDSGIKEDLAPAADLSPEEQESMRIAAQEQFDLENAETGKLDAFAQHAAPSATLGASDVLGGAAGAAGHLVGGLQEGQAPSMQELLDTYYEAKKDTQARREQALDDQPGASVAGMITGGFASPIPGTLLAKGGKAAQMAAKVLPSTKGLEKAAKVDKLAQLMKSRGKLDQYTKLKKAQLGMLAKESAIEGGKAGLVMGATQGDARLLEGEVGKTIEQSVIGTSIGAGAGLILGTGTKVTGDFISDFPVIKEIKSSFLRGMSGKGLGDEEVTSEIVGIANKFNKEFSAKLKKHGSAIGEAKKIADDLGITISTKSDLDKLSSVVNEIDSPTKKKQIKRVLAEIYDYIDDGAEQLKLQDKIEKQILKKRIDSQSVGEAARVKQQKKALKDAIQKGDLPYETESGMVGAGDVLGEPGPAVASVRKDQIMKRGKMVDKLSAEDATPFMPTKPEAGADPTTGRQFAIYKDKGTGQISSVVGNAIEKIDTENMTVKQADRLKNLLQDFSNLRTEGSEALTSEVKQAVTKASQSIGDQIKDVVATTSPSAKLDSMKYSKMKSTLKELKMVLPKNVKMSANDRQRTLQDKLHKFIVSPDSTMELKQLSNVIDDLSKVDQKLALEFSDEVSRLREVYQSQQRVSSDLNSTQIKSIGGSVVSLANRISNTLGRVVSAPVRAAKSVAGTATKSLAKQTQRAVNASPKQIQSMVGKISQSGNKAYEIFARPLTKAASSTPKQKQAIMFGLMQQSGFRDMVDDLSEE